MHSAINVKRAEFFLSFFPNRAEMEKLVVASRIMSHAQSLEQKTFMNHNSGHPPSQRELVLRPSAASATTDIGIIGRRNIV